jgi:hypothetical protein
MIDPHDRVRFSTRPEAALASESAGSGEPESQCSWSQSSVIIKSSWPGQNRRPGPGPGLGAAKIRAGIFNATARVTVQLTRNWNFNHES